MNSTVIVLNPPGLRIPTELPDHSAFRAWVNAAELPRGVRNDYLAGEVEIDTSPQTSPRTGHPRPPWSRVFTVSSSSALTSGSSSPTAVG